MLGIFREDVYSPNRVGDDAAILKLTAQAIEKRGYDVELVKPSTLSPDTPPDMTFAMCEGPFAVDLLEKWAALGYPVINGPRAVRNCFRYRMLPLISRTTVPVPKSLLIQTTDKVNGHFDLGKGLWVKRGDVHSTHPEDVELIFDRKALERTLEGLRSRWVRQALLQEHVRGDLIKFYGVRPQRWFRHFYHKPDEVRGYLYSLQQIQRTAEAAASKLGLEVYGGDIVVTETGHYLIDINSWPSFAICREEAAEQIASYIVRSYRRWEPSDGLQRRLA